MCVLLHTSGTCCLLQLTCNGTDVSALVSSQHLLISSLQAQAVSPPLNCAKEDTLWMSEQQISQMNPFEIFPEVPSRLQTIVSLLEYLFVNCQYVRLSLFVLCEPAQPKHDNGTSSLN